MVLVLYAHPYPDRSRVNRQLLRGIAELAAVEIRSLYDLYPDFAIDVAAEQEAVARHRALVLQHPLYWHLPPAAMVMWLEKVLLHGWAFGAEARAFSGKRCWWVVTIGSGEMQFLGDDPTAPPREAYETAVRHALERCGATWLAPMIIANAHALDKTELARQSAEYRAALTELVRIEAAGAEEPVG